MGIIAQGIITLTSVNDAFSVSLSPSSCVINADYNGKNPKLTYAYSDIKVIRGEVAVPFAEPKVLGKSNAATVDIIQIDDTTWRVKILSIPETDLNGSFQLEIKAGTDFQTVVTFAYTVVRETSMLDWILDWNGTYTEISGKWIITPKIFAGTKDADNKITGVYLGPAFDNSGSTGLYGYKDDEVIFELTETGGMIGGWHIENGGIQTSDGVLKILAEGTIISAPDGKMAWELLKDGTASFAGGNVHFYANGDADFKGTITSTAGQIGGWTIGTHSLYNNAILIDSSTQFIGIRRVANMIFVGEPSSEGFHKNIKQSGGIAIFSQNDVAYGMECWIPASNVINPTLNPVDGYKVFSLGYQNMIASWNFDAAALWIGAKNNTARQNTSSSGSITIGTAGIRGMNWYIDNDGEISFVNGLLHFDKNGGTIAGWTLNKNMFAVTNAALVSASGYTGLYLANSTLPESYTNYESHIIKNGGIFLTASVSGPRLHGRNTDGDLVFQLTGGVSFIGGWWFSESCLFTGASATPKGQFATANNITLSPDGLRGYKFRLEASGSGAIAGGKISWDDDGNITFDNSVKISWSQVTGTDDVMTQATYIDANGIFTGKISADNITAGAISTADIICDGKWALMRDGTGYLASRNISWAQNGELTVKGHIEANSGSIGTGNNKFTINSSGISYGDVSSFLQSDNSKKMLLNPESLRIQNSNPDDKYQVCKIYLGKGAWSRNAELSPYSTIAWIYKQDLRNLEMAGSRCCEPAVRIETSSYYGAGVAVSAEGAIISNGVIGEKGHLLTASTSAISMMHFSPFSGSTFIIKNTTGQECPVQLPHEGAVRLVLDLAVNEPFIYRIKAFCLPGNSNVVIAFSNNDTIKCYVNGREQAEAAQYKMAANHLYELTLIYDGNHHSVWHIKDIT